MGLVSRQRPFEQEFDRRRIFLTQFLNFPIPPPPPPFPILNYFLPLHFQYYISLSLYLFSSPSMASAAAAFSYSCCYNVSLPSLCRRLLSLGGIISEGGGKNVP